ncbi:MAG: hypothetical protein RM338_26390 [Nostoc sp. DedQUE12a]|nr:hypothetical protein [Nostoc sp. DedQUE12a]
MLYTCSANNPNKASLDLTFVAKGNLDPEEKEKLQVAMEKAAEVAIEAIKQ